MAGRVPGTVAEAYLSLLRARGVEWLFANAGTDFAPLIEALAVAGKDGAAAPRAVAIAHETVAVGMAHGYYLMTERPQAVMLHVDVGIANGLVGLMNAARANVPMLFTSGRTPYTEEGLAGSRDLPIHWGQEMADQGALVREHVKWELELARPEQLVNAVDRALAVAMAPPRGPVYLSLPRETLAAEWPAVPLPSASTQDVPTAPHPDQRSIEAAADLLAQAERPVAISSARTPGDRSSLADFASSAGIPVVEFWSPCQALSTEHPMHAGSDPGELLATADVVLVLDAQVPWVPRRHSLADGCRVVHVGPDPAFTDLPVRGHLSTLAITSEVEAALRALSEALEQRADLVERSRGAGRATLVASLAQAREARRKVTAPERDGVASRAWASSVLNEVLAGPMGEGAVLFNELGCVADAMSFPLPGSYFSLSIAGGLGWGLPAALGAQLADRDRLVVATVGDGSYIFANPVACHQTAEALGLPVLTVVFNNSGWEAVSQATIGLYPDGAAKAADPMPLSTLQPSPRFDQVIAASGGYGERVVKPEELVGAFERALRVVREERRHALVDVRIAPV